MTRNLIAALFWLLVLAWAPLAVEAREEPQAVLPAKEAQEQVATGSVTLIDVRTPAEYNEGHIKGAVNIDFFGPRFEEEMARLPKDQTILLYCKTGVRSARAAELLREAGFEKVMDLGGGITEWQNSGLPIEK